MNKYLFMLVQVYRIKCFGVAEKNDKHVTQYFAITKSIQNDASEISLHYLCLCMPTSDQ